MANVSQQRSNARCRAEKKPATRFARCFVSSPIDSRKVHSSKAARRAPSHWISMLKSLPFGPSLQRRSHPGKALSRTTCPFEAMPGGNRWQAWYSRRSKAPISGAAQSIQKNPSWKPENGLLNSPRVNPAKAESIQEAQPQGSQLRQEQSSDRVAPNAGIEPIANAAVWSGARNQP